VDRQFSAIAALARGCRFVDCTHQAEPGCAVRAAVEWGEVDPDAWAHYLKLLREGRHNLAEHERPAGAIGYSGRWSRRPWPPRGATTVAEGPRLSRAGGKRKGFAVATDSRFIEPFCQPLLR
jgi:ribosome biogenesis GTPase